MPRTYYRLLDNAEITVWSADKETDFYRDFLKANNFPISAAEIIKNQEKQRQWFVSRYVLTQSYPEAIQYYLDQKPMLMNGPRISLSHSRNEVAIMFSHGEGGIDIQWPDEKLIKIAPKYVNPEDLKTLEVISRLEAHTLIWSVKEAVFKYYGTGIAFRNISLKNYDPVHNTIQAEINRPTGKERKTLCADFIGEMAIAYLLE
jgi:phosphopantetheinyl transferase